LAVLFQKRDRIAKPGIDSPELWSFALGCIGEFFNVQGFILQLFSGFLMGTIPKPQKSKKVANA
jgi:hypothetical protein